MKMEKVALNNLQLDYLAGTHPKLAQVFYGTVPCDRLPRTIPQEGPTAYIVNTDPHDEPGRHWIAIWTEGNVSEIMDSYGLSLEVYGTTDPLLEWLNRHFKYQLHNGQSLQSLFSQSCGDYALMYLIDRAEGRSMQQFLNRFKKNDYVNNDRKVGQMMKRLIVDDVMWHKICKKPCCQDTRGSLEGVKHLLKLKQD